MSLVPTSSGSNPLGAIFGALNTVSNIVDKIDRSNNTPAAAPAPKVEIINPSPNPSFNGAGISQPPININLTVNVYKGDGDKESFYAGKSHNGLNLDLK